MCKRIFKEQTSDEGEVPFYKIGTFGGEPDAFISRELFDEYKAQYPYPNKGDILISASGSIGRTVEFTGKDEYFQDSNIVWLKHGNEIDNSFLKVLYGVVEWSCEGSTIKRLYNDNFLKTEFMLPQIDEQKKIGVYFSNLDHLITLHQRKCDELQKLKKFMLQNMFTNIDKGESHLFFECIPHYLYFIKKDKYPTGHSHEIRCKKRFFLRRMLQHIKRCCEKMSKINVSIQKKLL